MTERKGDRYTVCEKTDRETKRRWRGDAAGSGWPGPRRPPGHALRPPSSPTPEARGLVPASVRPSIMQIRQIRHSPTLLRYSSAHIPFAFFLST